jgi:hypothetical protein
MHSRLWSLVFLAIFLSTISLARGAAGKPWQFAVSGDSRNCGDVVMAAIARQVNDQHVEFYWHLGDFRLGSDLDEDMQQMSSGILSLDQYQQQAWPDFIRAQVDPFRLPQGVHLGLGNHELYLYGRGGEEHSHEEAIRTFGKWLGEPAPAVPKTGYYAWTVQDIDFINLDNSRDSGFDPGQMEWFENRLRDDQAQKSLHSVVVGMHRALPNSLACAHSMNGDSYSSPEANQKSLESGRKAYKLLWRFRNVSGKPVYVLASHSHFYMEDIFDTPYWRSRALFWDQDGKSEGPESPLNGWIIGTAGARRYLLPENLPAEAHAISYAYGYLLGTVKPDGRIDFVFQQITEGDVPPETVSKYGRKFVDFCFYSNRDMRKNEPEKSCADP